MLKRLWPAFQGAVLMLAGALVLRARYKIQDDAELADSLRQRVVPPPVLRSHPRVSTIAGAWNADEDLHALIDSFRSIDYGNKEFVLAVGGAHRLEEVQHLGGNGVVLIENPGGGKNAALVRCLEKATGEIVHVTDADCVLNNDAYLRLMAPIINGEEEVTTGASRPHQHLHQNFLVQLQWGRRALERSRTGTYSRRLFGRSFALTRSALATTGGLVIEVLGEDYFLGERLLQEGFRIRYVRDSVVETYYHTTVAGYLRQRSRWTRAVVLDGMRLGRYGDVAMSLRGSLVALLTLLLTVSLPFTRQRGLTMLLLPVLRSYLHYARQLAFGGRVGRIEPRWSHYGAILLHVYADLVASAGALFEYLIPSRRYRW